jgi:hypothetical protein
MMKSEKLISKAVCAFISMAAEQSKPAAYRAVCSARMAAVRTIAEYVEMQDKRRDFDRAVKKMPVQKLSDGRCIHILNPFAVREKHLYQKIVLLGELLFHSLDCWQTQGASLEELKILCNGGGMYWYRAVSDAEEGRTFSEIVFACNPDYKNKGDFLETTPDAPLTVCLKEFMLDQMLHTDHGRKAAHEAMELFFPEILESAVYPVTDSEGIVHYIDKDGVEYDPPKK